MYISKQFNIIHVSIILLFILVFSSCQKEKVKKEYIPTNAHEEYIYSLRQANLEHSALFKQFVESSKSALSNALKIQIPYSEIFYIDHTDPEAFGYRFSLKRGQKVKIKADVFNTDSIELFIDIFRIRDSLNTSWYKVASADKDSLYVEFSARRDAEYILRIQPELLSNLRCKVKIEKESSLGFPVLGKNKSAIQSFFGDPRDGGRRKHHGVDVFASRHSNVIASADGYISRIGNSKIGGKHIWVYYPSVGINCYYAHLESIEAKRGMKIKAGTIIGTVGNTGNAKYTPPHLHFGIYQYGPVDPYYFIATESIKAKKLSISNNLLGKSVRTANENVKINICDSIVSLPLHTELFVEAVNSNKLRVKLSDGQKGFIKTNQVEVTGEVLNYLSINKTVKFYNNPSVNGLIIRNIFLGEYLEIISYHNEFSKVKLKTGEIGWMQSKDLIQS